LLQDRSLRAAVVHAYENVPFYRRFWDKQGFYAGSVRDIQDLERIPIIDSPMVRKDNRPWPLCMVTSDFAGENIRHLKETAKWKLDYLPP
jgi:phenylacetate-CoA ligase